MVKENKKNESKEELEKKLYEGEIESLDSELDIFRTLLMNRFQECINNIMVDYERLEDKIKAKGMKENMDCYLNSLVENIRKMNDTAIGIYNDKDYFSERTEQKKRKRLEGVPYEGLFGLEEQIAEFEEALASDENIILCGPPGCGKTEILRGYMIKHQDDTYIACIKQNDLLGVYFGETEKAITALFDEVEKKKGIIILDEGEWLFQKRRDEIGSRQKNDMVSAMLAEIDGIEKNRNVRVVISTNRVDMMDSAFMRAGRFDTVIEIPEPDDDVRRKILEYNFDKMMEHGVLNDYSVNMDNLVNATKEFNAADIVKGLCYKLSKYCTKNKIKKLDDETLCNYLKERERDIYDRFYAVDHGKKVLEKIPTGYA